MSLVSEENLQNGKSENFIWQRDFVITVLCLCLQMFSNLSNDSAELDTEKSFEEENLIHFTSLSNKMLLLVNIVLSILRHWYIFEYWLWQDDLLFYLLLRMFCHWNISYVNFVKLIVFSSISNGRHVSLLSFRGGQWIVSL